MDSISSTKPAKISPSNAATLVALALKRAKNKAGQPRSRARMTYNTFRRLTGRRIGGARFVREFSEELSNLGWLMVRMPSAYGFVRATSLASWSLTKSNLVAKELEQISGKSPEKALDNARLELGGSTDVGGSSNTHK